MKIGIITQPLHSNYGGLLQNYALQQVLLRMGHDPVTIDTNTKSMNHPLWFVAASIVKTFLLKIAGKGKLRNYPLSKQQNEYIQRYTQLFIKKYIRHTPKTNGYKDMITVSTQLSLNAFIVGSDQVWRPCYNQYPYRSFLDFTTGWKIKRVAYAASFGVDKWEFTTRQTQKCKKLIQQFDTVSVREKSGIALCRDYLEREACQMPDPTLLLDVEDYINLIKQEHEPHCEGNLLIYILDNQPYKANLVKKVAHELKLHPFSTINRQEITDKNKIEKLTYIPVTCWLRHFMDAEFVICDSFHGTVFSIIFNKPFIVIPNEERGNTRFDSLLQTFNLESRMTDGKDLSAIFKPINWEKVNQKKNELKQEGISFLRTALEVKN